MSRAELAPRWSFRVAVLSEHCDLPPNAKLVLLAIDSRRSERSPMPFPSQETIAADTGISIATIRRMVALAVSGGWLQRTHRWKAGGGRTSSVYGLSIPESIALRLSDCSESIPLKLSAMGGGIPLTVSDEVVNKTLSVKKRGPSNGTPWLTPFLEAYGKQAGTLEPSHLAKIMAPVRAAVGDEQALAVLRTFLDSQSVRYGINYFGQHWREFVPEKLVLENGELNPKAMEQAKRLGILT